MTETVPDGYSELVALGSRVYDKIRKLNVQLDDEKLTELNATKAYIEEIQTKSEKPADLSTEQIAQMTASLREIEHRLDTAATL